MRIAIYSRVSTEKQDAENQLAQLREFAAKQDWKVFDDYIDSESGSKSNRPQFQRMFTDASKRKFDLVLFWALDRFSREGVFQTLQHLNRLESFHVQWRSFTESYFDSCGPFKDAVVSILAVLAKQERIKISERTKAGLAIARAKGKTLGRPRCTVDMAAIQRLRAAGKSWRAVGAALGVSAATALHARSPRFKKGLEFRGRKASTSEGQFQAKI